MIQELISYIRFKNTLFLPRQNLEKIQLQKLQRILIHAYKTVPYYTTLFDKHNIHPKDIQTLDDLKKIPITDKKHIRYLDKKELVSSTYLSKHLHEITTSGTTGTPFKIYRTHTAIKLSRAIKLRKFNMNGYKLNWKIAVFTQYKPTNKKWFYKLGIHRIVDIPGSKTQKKQLRIINSEKPELFNVMPSKITELSRYIEQHTITKFHKPKRIICSSETLTQDDEELITRVWNNIPNNSYESREFANIACDCPYKQGLHVDMDCVIVEVDGEGNTGNAVITDLTNFAMPLIRYNIGDVITLANTSCPCGRNTQIIQGVQGRTNDYIILPSGKKVPGAYAVSKSLYECQGAKEFRVVQKKDGHLEIKIIRNTQFEIPEEEIIQSIKENNEGIPTTIKYVNTLPTLRSGKRQFFTSEMNQE